MEGENHDSAWELLLQHAARSYALEKLAPDGFSMVWTFDIDDAEEVEQPVAVTLAAAGDGAWIDVVAPIGPTREIDGPSVMEEARGLPIGAVVLERGEYLVRHTVRVGALSTEAFDRILLEIARGAARLFDIATTCATRRLCELFQGFI